VVEAIARVLQGPETWQHLKQGEIAVVVSTTAAFNCMLPLVAGIVSDFGGTLTHAAVSAREFGVPCVVATEDATQRIPDGAKIRLDGTAGKISIL
jgi:pyruvate,water dikinase